MTLEMLFPLCHLSFESVYGSWAAKRPLSCMPVRVSCSRVDVASCMPGKSIPTLALGAYLFAFSAICFAAHFADGAFYPTLSFYCMIEDRIFFSIAS